MINLFFRARRKLDPEVVQKYRDREREMNVKTIKKVVEAKARKKRKVEKRMESAKKKAAALLDNEDIGKSINFNSSRWVLETITYKINESRNEAKIEFPV